MGDHIQAYVNLAPGLLRPDGVNPSRAPSRALSGAAGVAPLLNMPLSTLFKT
jgi:hypothetical protein